MFSNNVSYICCKVSNNSIIFGVKKNDTTGLVLGSPSPGRVKGEETLEV